MWRNHMITQLVWFVREREEGTVVCWQLLFISDQSKFKHWAATTKYHTAKAHVFSRAACTVPTQNAPTLKGRGSIYRNRREKRIM